MPHVLAVRGALPEHRYPQAELTEGFADLVGIDPSRRRLLQRVHGNAGVRFRHLALPLDDYAELSDFGAANDAFIAAATELGANAVEGALKDAGIGADEVDLIVSVSTTGLAAPSLDARIAATTGLRTNIVRMPLVGLGCVAGAAGLARINDYLVGHPDHLAVLVSMELCSLTVQRDDVTTPNLIASGLFGDGAAAAVLAGDERLQMISDPPGPAVLASASRLYPDTERAMGWDVGSSGLRIVLGAEIPDLVRREVGGDVDRFLAGCGLTRDDISWWVAHPGGPKVLLAMQEALGLEHNELGVTWDLLARMGNLSSASVLFVLAETLAERPPEPGSYGLMLALGPGFALEVVLLQARTA
jgi:alkylresorcinol/alkylpyrone synthase